MKKLRIGVIGTGRIGRLHANNLVSSVKDADVVAVSDMNLPAAREVAEALQIPACYADYHEILNDPTIDAVFICSSTDTHSVISMEAARAGKHIFCEKPIDHDLDKIREVLKTVKEAGVLYQVGFNRFYFHQILRYSIIVILIYKFIRTERLTCFVGSSLLHII